MQQQRERKVPDEEMKQKEKCPRCESLNTKFCYYNNYSLSQPRYFCKTCRRYWTHGGTLRNVPVGGGSRSKSKRPKTPSSSSSSQPSTIPSSTNPVLVSASVSPNSTSIETGAFAAYLPSLEPLNQPQIFSPAGVAVYSFGSEYNWVHHSFHNNSNPTAPDASTWPTNKGTASSADNSSRRVTNNSSSENSLIPNSDRWSGNLLGYGHPP